MCQNNNPIIYKNLIIKQTEPRRRLGPIISALQCEGCVSVTGPSITSAACAKKKRDIPSFIYFFMEYGCEDNWVSPNTKKEVVFQKRNAKKVSVSEALHLPHPAAHVYEENRVWVRSFLAENLVNDTCHGKGDLEQLFKLYGCPEMFQNMTFYMNSIRGAA